MKKKENNAESVALYHDDDGAKAVFLRKAR